MKRLLFPPYLLLIAATTIILTGCNGDSQAASTIDDAIAVKLQPVTTTQYAPVLKYSGSMASTSEARLSFKIGGIISRIYVKKAIM